MTSEPSGVGINARRTIGREAAALLLFVLAATCGLALWAARVHSATPVIMDELVYLWQARWLAVGQLTRPAPAFPEFVSVSFLPILDGRRFGHYPIGFPAALAPAVAAGAPWALNVLLGGLSLAMLHRLCRRLDGPWVAWVATILLALSPFFVIQATTFFNHLLTLFLTLVALLAMEKRERSRCPSRWTAVAGAATGYALNVSPFVAAPMALVALERGISARHVVPLSVREVAAFAVPTVAGLLLFLAVNRATTGDPLRPGYFVNTTYVAHKPGFGGSVGEGGYTPAMALGNTAERLALMNRILFGWPLTSFLFAGPYLAFLLAAPAGRRRLRARPDAARDAETRPDRWDRTHLVLLTSTVGIFALWFFPAADEGLGPRYLFTTLPSLVVFTARGLAGLRDLGRRVAAARRGGAAIAGALPFVLVASLVAAGTIPSLARLAEGPLARWRRGTHSFLSDLERRGVVRGTIFVESPEETTLAASLLFASGFDETGDLVFAMNRGPEENARFLERRPEGPVYYVKPRMQTSTWQLHDRPVWERRAG